MGRKKSKVSKKKQAKAAARTCAKKSNKGLGGVPASKGGLLSVPASIIQAAAGASAASKKSNAKTKTPKKKNGKGMNPTWQGMNQKNMTSKAKVTLTTAATNGERSDFDKEFASMQERQFNQIHKKNQKGNKIEFAAPTLRTKKTAEELVNDAAHQISEMVDVGQKHTHAPPFNHHSSSLLQAMAHQKKTEGYVPQPKVMTGERYVPPSNNMFSALEEDSEEEGATPNSSVPSFSFTAPTFSFQSSFHPTAAAGGSHVLEDDPDL